MVAPIAKPIPTRCTETRVAAPSVPSWSSSTKVCAICCGEASLRSASSPVLLASCQRPTIRTGETHRAQEGGS